jgi:hypothetical protein
MVLCRQRETAMWFMLFADDGIHILFAYDSFLVITIKKPEVHKKSPESSSQL